MAPSSRIDRDERDANRSAVGATYTELLIGTVGATLTDLGATVGTCQLHYYIGERSR